MFSIIIRFAMLYTDTEQVAITKTFYLYSFLSGLQRQNCLERVIPYRKQKNIFAKLFSVGI